MTRLWDGIKRLSVVDLGDVHVYGGLLLIGCALGEIGWGITGLALVYIGLWRMK